MTPAQRRVVERALRVTVAATVAFYLCLYVVHSPNMAVYAAFGCIAIGALSEVAGPPRSRLVSYLVALAVGIPLVVVGSLLAGSTLAASVGMLVVGFGVGLSATFGGRMLGLGNGLQLLYILPSFPPYEPEVLGERLLGLVLGVGLLVLLDVVVRPQPGLPGYERRLAASVDPLVAYLGAVRGRVCDPRPDAPAVPPEVRTAAREAVDALRPELLPVSRRPSGPSAYDHALRGAGLLLTALEGRITRLDRLVTDGGLAAEPAAAALIDAIAVQLVRCGAAFEALEHSRRKLPTELLPEVAAVEEAVRTFDRRRLRIVEEVVLTEPAGETQLRFDSVTAEAAVVAASLAVATCAACGHPVDVDDPDLGAQFTPQTRSAVGQWWGNLRIHLDPRSVILQNALRLALGLAIARTVAGVFDLSHGFWVLLATLTLMRTTTSATRGALGPAVAGTVIGAIVSAVLLTVWGDHPVVFVVLLPFALLAGLAATPLGAPVLGQACFTIVVALLFTQVTPSSWRLAEARLVDVLVGAGIGLLTGLLVWPRGAGPLRRALVGWLRASSRLMQQSVQRVGDPLAVISPVDLRAARAAEVLAAATYAQFLAERPSGAREVPELTGTVVLARRLAVGSRELRVDRVNAFGGDAAVEAARLLHTMAAVRAGAVAVLADALERQEAPLMTPLEDGYAEVSAWLELFRGQHLPAMTLDVVDGRSWLVGVGHDVEHVAAAAAARRR